MRFLAISFVLTFCHVSWASEITTTADGISFAAKSDVNGKPVVSIVGVNGDNYQYLADRLNAKIQATTLNCARSVVKCSRIGFQPTGAAIVAAGKAFPDIRGKNEAEQQKILVVRGKTESGTQYYWASLPRDNEEFKKGANLCKGLAKDCAWEVDKDLKTNGKFGWGTLNTAIFESWTPLSVPQSKSVKTDR